MATEHLPIRVNADLHRFEIDLGDGTFAIAEYTLPPGTISFTPRPDWYFYFLFYLLRIFKWPESVILGTIGIPTICVLLLIAIPFLDTRAERRPLHRPVAMVTGVLVIFSMGMMTYRGATAKESLGSELIGKVPEWAAKQGFADNPKAILKLGVLDQLDLVKKYFDETGLKKMAPATLDDLYLPVLKPASRKERDPNDVDEVPVIRDDDRSEEPHV